MSSITPSIKKRKSLHLRYALDPQSQTGSTGLEQVRLPYTALPQRSLDAIDLSLEFLGKKVSYPFFISCMTGGPQKARMINTRLAKAAQKLNIPMGLGSLRIVLKYPELLPTFQVRKYAPDILLMSNLGAVSLNYGLTWRDCQKIVDMVEADALVLHVNPLQEALQLGGDTNFQNLLPKIEQVVKKITVPVIVKEVGHGIDYQTAKSLFDIGVNIIDTAGVGGTSWAWIEAKVAGNERKAALFKDVGISTYDSITQCTKIKGLTVLGSGGIRTGVDIAKVLFLGCRMAGLAWPFLCTAMHSHEAVDALCHQLIDELKIALFCQQEEKKVDN
jgi:isopentenyl-diphosphate delta-isomerase